MTTLHASRTKPVTCEHRKRGLCKDCKAVLTAPTGSNYACGWKDAIAAVAKRLRAEHGEEAARIAERVRPPMVVWVIHEPDDA